ncbi:MAG: HAD-IA family hydrolase [Acidimicrobiia bacterium]|nr:HAD-IA family hydrolase [Acidimicrobiia bacterium]NNC76051.1 HAD-IA family hydrolase [Acidimicrobiia bacterium]
MADVSTLFFDIGGVLLTNGWDRHSRRAAIDELGLDWEEFQDRHDFVADAFETDAIDLDTYLERTVFYRSRPFTQDEMVDCMYRQSKRLGDTLDFVHELARSGEYVLATLNNESRAINEHRIDEFGLRDIFSVFVSSCYVGAKKPDEEIYRLALDLTQKTATECVFIDDRALNLECATSTGMRTIHFESAEQLEADLAAVGVTR